MSDSSLLSLVQDRIDQGQSPEQALTDIARECVTRLESYRLRVDETTRNRIDAEDQELAVAHDEPQDADDVLERLRRDIDRYSAARRDIVASQGNDLLHAPLHPQAGSALMIAMQLTQLAAEIVRDSPDVHRTFTEELDGMAMEMYYAHSSPGKQRKLHRLAPELMPTVGTLREQTSSDDYRTAAQKIVDDAAHVVASMPIMTFVDIYDDQDGRVKAEDLEGFLQTRYADCNPQLIAAVAKRAVERDSQSTLHRHASDILDELAVHLQPWIETRVS